MKKIPHVIFVIVFSASNLLRGQASSEILGATAFLDHLGIGRGEETSATNTWHNPNMLTISNTNVRVEVEDDFGVISGTLENLATQQFCGRFEIIISSSEANSRLFWALRETANSMPPNLYWDSYLIQTNIPDRIFAWKTSNNGPEGAIRRTNRVVVLYKNIEVDKSSDDYSPDFLALTLLRAGGVDIPEEAPPAP